MTKVLSRKRNALCAILSTIFLGALGCDDSIAFDEKNTGVTKQDTHSQQCKNMLERANNLSSEFQDFSSKKNYVFSIPENYELDIQATTSQIVILQSCDEKIHIEVDASKDQLDNFNAWANHEGAKISYHVNPPTNGAAISTAASRSTVRIYGNNNHVVIAGRENSTSVTTLNNTVGNDSKVARIIISVPNNGRLKSDISGIGQLVSDVVFLHADLRVSGKFLLIVRVNSAFLNASGENNLCLSDLTNHLRINTLDNSSVRIIGNPIIQEITSSGRGTINIISGSTDNCYSGFTHN